MDPRIYTGYTGYTGYAQVPQAEFQSYQQHTGYIPTPQTQYQPQQQQHSNYMPVPQTGYQPNQQPFQQSYQQPYQQQFQQPYQQAYQQPYQQPYQQYTQASQSSFQLPPKTAFVQGYVAPSYVAQPYAPTSFWTQLVQSFIPRSSGSGLDWWSMLLLLLIWSLLILICSVLLFLDFTTTDPNSPAGQYVTLDEIARVIIISAVPTIICTIMNEVLIERVWRRIELFAIEIKPRYYNENRERLVDMVDHLRASNFGLGSFFMRLFAGKLSFRDVRPSATWCLLRLGTAAAIASTQLCVKWVREPNVRESDGSFLFEPEYRVGLIVVPVMLHIFSVFGSVFLWSKIPCALFMSKYNDRTLWQAYKPYMQEVQGGSISSACSVAEYLSKKAESKQPDPLTKTNSPGAQIWRKLKGVTFGFFVMLAPPALAFGYTYYAKEEHSELLRNGVFRFLMQFTLLVQNIFYTVSLDFILWNLSVEGLCRTTSRDSISKNPKQFHYMGISAGLVLPIKIWYQRRPWRVFIFFILFYIQACVMRLLTTYFGLVVQAWKYKTETKNDSYNPNFWIGWLIITGVITLPLISIWLFWPFEAPIGEQDRWKWARINDERFEHPDWEVLNHYGVVKSNNKLTAMVHFSAEKFSTYKGKKLDEPMQIIQ